LDEPKGNDSDFGGFPKFDAPKTDDGDAGLGGFPKFDEPKANGSELPKFGEAGAAGPVPAGFQALADEPAKPEVPACAGTPETVRVPGARPASPEPLDLSFGHFLELINHPCWDYTGSSPAELFGHKDRFSTVDEAFAFLVNQS
jgi:hypothetical protein